MRISDIFLYNGRKLWYTANALMRPPASFEDHSHVTVVFTRLLRGAAACIM